MTKYQKLVFGIVLDIFGYISFVLYPLGELSDIIWAPVSGWLMTKMYKGKAGKIAAVIVFIEEAMPFIDVIPTFTIMWFYTYVYKKESLPKQDGRDLKNN